MPRARSSAIAAAIAVSAWLVAAPAGVARAQTPEQPVVVGGLRPTGDSRYRSTEIKRLREALDLREFLDEVVASLTRSEVVEHSDLRQALGSAYLVDFFECRSSPGCVKGVFDDLGERAGLLVYGDYTVRRVTFSFRLRLLDLKTGQILEEVEFSLRGSELEDRSRWKRELEPLLASVAVADAPGGGGDPEGGDGTSDLDDLDGGGGGGSDTGDLDDLDDLDNLDDLDDVAGSGGGDELDDLGGLDDLDALDELDALEGGGGAGERSLVKHFRGEIATEFRTYPLERGGPRNDEQVFITTELELDVHLGGNVSLTFRPRFLIDTLDTGVTRFEPFAGYLQYVTEKADVRAGQFVDNWGIADAFNPLDVLNRRDYASDIIDPTPLGELGLRLRYQLPSGDTIGQPTISVYAMPLWRKTLLPTEDYRYSLSQPPFVLLDDPETPELEDAFFGALRLQHTVNLSAFSADFQYVGARGPARFPTFIPMPQPDGTVQLATAVYGALVGGGGFRLVPNGSWLSTFTLKTEVVYTRPYSFDPAVPKPDRYLQYVVGFDRIFDGVLSDLDALTFTAEYLGEELADDLLSQFRPFNHDVAVRLFWQANNFSRTTIELRGIVDIETYEAVGEAILGRQLRFLHDDLNLELHVQWVMPEEDGEGFFAFFPNNSNVRARFGFNF